MKYLKRLRNRFQDLHFGKKNGGGGGETKTYFDWLPFAQVYKLKTHTYVWEWTNKSIA